MAKKTASTTGSTAKASKAKKPASKKPAKQEELPSSEDWQKMLDDLGTESNDPRLYYIKQGRNRIRLVPENGDPKRFYHSFTRTYDGQVRTKYLIRGIVLGREDNSVTAIPVGKSVLKSILNLLAEGYDLFDPEEGLGISIVRSGSNLETSYMVLPSPKPVPIPDDYTELQDSLSDVAESIVEADEDRQNEGSGKRGKASMGKGKGKRSAANEDVVEDDEEGW